MSDFASKALKQVDLGNDKWVKIPAEPSFEQVKSCMRTDGTLDIATAATSFVKEWNLLDDDGTVAAVTQENFDRLKVAHANLIFEAIGELVVAKADEGKGKSEPENSLKQ